ncbi:S1C family serine protease [Sphaerotilaceae bacterium SBD11-9]
MKHLLRLSSLLALVAGSATCAAMTPAEMYARVSPSVWRVTTYDRDGLPFGQGSGVVVGPESVVTNCHVLRLAQKVAVHQGKTTLTATLSHWDVQRDVCQLKVAGLQAPAVALGDSAQLKVGQEVYAIGNPRGFELTMSAGLVSSFRRNESNQLVLIQTSAAISAGSSGGGLFDGNGRLLGLTTIGSVGADTQNLNFAIPVDWVRELPERHARLSRPAQDAASAPSTAVASTEPAAAPPQPPLTTVARAPVPVPAPAPVAPAVPTATQAASGRDITNLALLPYASERMRERYSQFLTRPLPRAFVVSESGDWRVTWGMPAGTAGSPAERAMKECEALKRGRCFVYAVDNEVVFRP